MLAPRLLNNWRRVWKAQPGMTILELVISMSITSVAMAGLYKLSAGALRSYQEVKVTFHERLELRNQLIEKLHPHGCSKEDIGADYILYACSEEDRDTVYYITMGK